MSSKLNEPRFSRLVIGVLLLTAGVLVPTTFFVWYSHVQWILVDEPIELSPGHIRVELTPNFKGLYVGGIRAQRTLNFETLQCLLGEKNYIRTDQCKEISPVLTFTWQLKSNGRILQHGTSDGQLLGAYADDFIEMEFLYSEFERGQPYILDLEITKSGSDLSATNPRLRVAVHSWDSFDMSLGFVWMIPFVLICVPSGLLLIARNNGSVQRPVLNV